VELPTTSDRPQSPRSSRPAPPSQRPPSSAPTTVLIVEDQADAAELFADLLSRQGYKVVTAGSVAAALALPSDSFDIIVSDLGLPDGTGNELIRKLQAIRRRPAIALSGFGMPADVETAKRSGFDTHLTKPVDVALLYAALEQLLGSCEIKPAIAE
jgi:CheY-like chemotaxis protein